MHKGTHVYTGIKKNSYTHTHLKHRHTHTYIYIYIYINIYTHTHTHTLIHKYIYIYIVGWLFGFYGISTFRGYLTPNPLLYR